MGQWQAVENAMQDQIRCFVGARVSSSSRQSLSAALDLPAGVRRVAPVDWHLTLKFLGSVPVAALDGLLAVVDRLESTPVEVRVLGFMGLPRAGAARVVAAEVAPDPCLSRWVAELERTLGPADLPFRPHVTLARARRPIRFEPIVLAVALAIELEPPALYRSHLERTGARYERVVARQSPAARDPFEDD